MSKASNCRTKPFFKDAADRSGVTASHDRVSGKARSVAPKLSKTSPDLWKPKSRWSKLRQQVPNIAHESWDSVTFWANCDNAPAPEHPCEVLGITSDPGRDEILKALDALANRFHPNHKQATMSSGSVTLYRAIQIYEAIHEAYRWYQEKDKDLPLRLLRRKPDAATIEQYYSPPSDLFWADTADLPAPADPYECLGVAPTADQDTIQVAFEELILTREQRTSNLEARYRLQYTNDEFREAYSRIRQSRAIQGSWRPSRGQNGSSLDARTRSQSPAARFWWHAPVSQLKAPESPFEVLGLDRTVDMSHVHLAAGKLLSDWDPEGVPDPAAKRRAIYVHGKLQEAYEIFQLNAERHEVVESLKKLQDAHADTFPPNPETTPKSQSTEGHEPDRLPTMFMHYTISEDRSGDNDSVASARLAALGARSRQPQFSNASLALLGSRGGL